MIGRGLEAQLGFSAIGGAAAIRPVQPYSGNNGMFSMIYVPVHTKL